jgi:RNA polymerase sigma-32 factor
MELQSFDVFTSTAGEDAGGTIDAQTENRLVRRAKNGDAKARAALVRTFAKRVGFLVCRGFRGSARYEDLLQEGYVGLMEALDHFDPERGFRFWTYAKWWVHARVSGYATRNRRLVSCSGRAYRRVVHGLARTETRLQQVQGQTRPDRGSVAEALNVDEDELANAELLLRGHDEPYDEAIPGRGLAGGASTPETRVAEGEWLHKCGEHLHEAMRGLDPRERSIVEARHLRDPQATLSELSEQWGVSRERIRQLELRALGKLRSSAAQPAGLTVSGQSAAC